MKTAIFIVFTLLFTPVIAAESDRELTEKIVGMWWNRTSNGHIAVESTENFGKDGILITKGDVYANGQLVEQYEFKSTWKIENGNALVEVLESTNIKTIPVGLKISDRIISVDDEKYVYEAEDGSRHTLTRLEKKK